jgi:hypothetical protein
MADTTEDEQQVPHLRILELLPIAVKSRVFLLRYTILDFLSMIFRSQFLMKLLWVLNCGLALMHCLSEFQMG